jgi:hypothetical protein
MSAAKLIDNQPCGNSSPYTIKNLDHAIAHLEKAIRYDCANPVFGRAYWQARVQQACLTPSIIPSQLSRLQRLLAAIARS